MKEVYHSENGDRWFLCRNDDGQVYIEHKANLSSGGKVTIIELGDFLGKGRAGPEHQAQPGSLEVWSRYELDGGEV